MNGAGNSAAGPGNPLGAGIPMVGGVDHYDHVHSPGHCANPECLMSYTVHTSQVWSLFDLDTDLPDFDADCLNDLKAAGGR